MRKRPGMYTDTTTPDHLAQEVIDNSIDEVLAGHASRLAVTLHEDGSLEVDDDGRGMPVDPHPELERPGAEVILTMLHSGAKFSNRNYRYAGGLHGVGVSIVNALSKDLEVWIRRGGQEYNMGFSGGDVRTNWKWSARSASATPEPGFGFGRTPNTSTISVSPFPG